MSSTGELIPTDIFYEWVLPYFERRDLFGSALILSSIGRWSGEEDQVMSVAAGSGHDIKAAVILNVSESDVLGRYNEAKLLNDRGEREDDRNETVFRKRLQEFNEKTLPVLKHYSELGLLVSVNGDQSRDAVFSEMIEKLYQKAVSALS
jgi:adenylate kinase